MAVLVSQVSNAQHDERVKSLGVGGGHACAITWNGTIYCWERDDAGQVTGAPSSGEFVKIELGETSSCALLDYRGSDFTCWGGPAPYAQIDEKTTKEEI